MNLRDEITKKQSDEVSDIEKIEKIKEKKDIVKDFLKSGNDELNKLNDELVALYGDAWVPGYVINIKVIVIHIRLCYLINTMVV